MEENQLINVKLNKSQSTTGGSLLFIDVPRSMSNGVGEIPLIKDNEKQPSSEFASSNGSEAGQDNSRRKKALPSDTLLDSANRLRSFFFDDNIFKSNSEEFLKTKILGIWHSMKYGWASNIRTNFSKDIPICMLGKAYHRTFTMDNHECSDIDGFKRDFKSVLWFTYRQKFPLLEGTILTSDCGWGCMIRSGQMMIASALKRHILPKGWTYGLHNSLDDKEKHKKILNWFRDFPSPSCPFSIHNLVKLGNKFSKQAGSWYGPSCICHIFKDAFTEYAISIPELKNISVIISQDGGVYLQDIIDECSSDCCICPAEIGCEALTKDRPCEALIKDRPCEALIKDRPCESLIKDRPCEALIKDRPCETLIKDRPCEASKSSSNFSPKSIPSSDLNFDCSKHFVSNSVANGPQSDCVNGAEKMPLSFSQHCTRSEQSECSICEHWKPSIILVPMRLGRSSVNSLYYQCIFSLLLHDLCIGIIGGRPKHSLFFVGFQDKHLIHIDPHLIQDTVNIEENNDYSSYHCSVPRKMSISKMDPSAAVGFFCPTKSDFLRLVKEIPQLVSAKEGNMESSLFEFIDAKSPLQQLELEDFECETVDLSSVTGCPSEDEELIC